MPRHTQSDLVNDGFLVCVPAVWPGHYLLDALPLSPLVPVADMPQAEKSPKLPKQR